MVQPRILPGHYTALTDRRAVRRPIIGPRINRLLAVPRWWPVFTAMPAMLREPAADPAKGFPGAQTVPGVFAPAFRWSMVALRKTLGRRVNSRLL